MGRDHGPDRLRGPGLLGHSIGIHHSPDAGLSRVKTWQWVTVAVLVAFAALAFVAIKL
jgi:hypothetical protein